METAESMIVEEMYSSKGKALMIHAGYKFRLYRDKANYKFWRCCTKNCCSSIKIDNGGKVIHQNVNHSHEKPKNLQRELIRNRFKQRISDGDVTKSVVDEELKNMPQRVSEISPNDVRAIKRAIRISAKKNRQTARFSPEVIIREFTGDNFADSAPSFDDFK